SGLKNTLRTGLVCPWREDSSCPVWASHTFTPPSSRLVSASIPEEETARRMPSGLKHTPLTGPVCPRRVRTSFPVWASHTFTSQGLSGTSPPEALARRLPSALKHTELTECLCPVRVSNSWPVWASHTFTVLSAQALARQRPSGLKSTGSTMW